MLHIVLLILKILLITVLILLGLALVLLLLILFAPVGYRVYAEKHENFLCKIKVSWLGFVLCFKATYDQAGFLYRLRSFGGTLVTNEGMTAGQTGDTTQDREKRKEEKQLKKEEKKQKKAEKAEKAAKESQNTAKANPAGRVVEEEEIQFVTDDSDLQEKKTGIVVKIGRLLDRLVITVRDKLAALAEKIRNLKHKANQYKRFLRASHTRQAWEVVKKNLIRLLKHIKPKKIRGNLTYGTGDPASTGQQLGYMSVALPLYYNKIEITPDFSRKIFDGDIFVKGRLRVFNILIYACKVVLNKYVKKTIRHFKKISGGNE